MNFLRLFGFGKKAAAPHPDAVLVPSEPDPEDRFYCVGVDQDGNQFMGFVTGAYPANEYPKKDEDWRPLQRWYSVMHTFDAEGKHLSTTAWCAGTSADEDRGAVAERAHDHLRELFSAIRRPSKRAIRVLPFSYADESYVFGLFIEDDGDEPGERTAMLQPNDVMFDEPWDGEYST